MVSDCDRQFCLSSAAFGVAHQAVESINVKDETVLVLGCGPVGLFSAGIAKCMGASRV